MLTRGNKGLNSPSASSLYMDRKRTIIVTGYRTSNESFMTFSLHQDQVGPEEREVHTNAFPTADRSAHIPGL